MSLGLIELVGEDVLCSVLGGDEVRLPWSEAESQLTGWAERYERASARDNMAELLSIGQEMFGWLDETGWASGWADGPGERELEVRVRGREGDTREAVLLDVPWELLARDGVALALNAMRLFSVARRIGPVGQPWVARHGDLQLMFMAAAPEGQVELDFEHEEAAILEATRGDGRVHVTVEETGTLGFLGGRLASEEGPFEAVHLSGHGDIVPGRGPVLLLETPEGEAEPVGPGEVVEAMGFTPVPLVVLSACRTAEAGRPPTGVGGTELAASFARQLAVMVANVVGWDGSVYDRDATDLAQILYGELGRGSPVPRAAAVARRALLRRRGEDVRRGRHWHLARVYLGPGGGGPLCAAGKPRRKSAGQLLERAFLDKDRQRVPVAPRLEFVGRRREIQRVLRGLRDGRGVLVHGMGALGKSSLAARVISRVAPRQRPVVVFGRYDALSILDEILEALPAVQRDDEAEVWRARVKAKPARLAEALEAWLDGPLDAAPVLLVVDDLERALQTPRPGDLDAAVGVAPDYREALGALLRAFGRAQTASRLLLTSRYDVRLPDGAGGDLAADLERVPLRPMPPRERIKQLRAAERLTGREDAASPAGTQALLERALDAAAGNPGLQAILTRPMLSGELAAAEAALAQIEYYRSTGAPPSEVEALIASGAAKDSENALTAFFARLSFETYRAALTENQARQITAATLFAEGVPIPRGALEAAGAALGVEAAGTALARLLGLGLLDDWGEIAGVAHAAANPLARPLAPLLDPADRPRLARAAMPHLVKIWRRANGAFPTDPRSLVATETALEAGAKPDILEAAAFAGAAWLARAQGETRPALDLIERTLAVLPPEHASDPDFVRLGLECATALGEVALLKCLLALPVRPALLGDRAGAVAQARLDLRRAEWLLHTGEAAQGEALTRVVLAAFRAEGDERMAAIAAGQVADMLHAQGKLDEALRIRRKEVLPVLERLGEIRERAVTLGKVADVLHARGEFDEALRIRLTEEVPTYEYIDDAREHSVVLQKIAAGLIAASGLYDQTRFKQARDAATEAYAIARRLRLPDGIAHAGALLAELLGREGSWREALAVLDEAEAGFRKISDARGQLHVSMLRFEISRRADRSP